MCNSLQGETALPCQFLLPRSLQFQCLGKILFSFPSVETNALKRGTSTSDFLKICNHTKWNLHEAELTIIRIFCFHGNRPIQTYPKWWLQDGSDPMGYGGWVPTNITCFLIFFCLNFGYNFESQLHLLDKLLLLLLELDKVLELVQLIFYDFMFIYKLRNKIYCIFTFLHKLLNIFKHWRLDPNPHVRT